MTEYKVLDHGFVRVIDTMGSDERVIQAARISYGREDVKDGEGLINYLIRHRHTSPLENCVITLHVKCPIFVARQWFRHRTWSFNEISGRYIEFKDEFYIPEVFHYQSKSSKQGSGGVHPLTEDFRKSIKEAYEKIYEDYCGLIEHGVAKEQARMMLPLATYTQFYATVDLHNLLHFLKLRTDQTAQWEIRKYADVIEKIVAGWCPVVHQAWANYVRDSVTFSAKAMDCIRTLLEGDWRETLEMDLREYGLSKGEIREIMESLSDNIPGPNDALIRAAKRYKAAIK